MTTLRAWRGPIILGVVYLVVGIISRQSLARTLEVTREYLVEMALIIPAVLILMGLFEVWVPRDMIQRLLGQRSGTRGTLLAFFLGTAPTGPLYVAFPVASSLLKKGASTVNVIVFLGAWAAAKLPLVAAEIRFLGPDFALLRLALTGLSLPIMGHLAQVFMADRKQAASRER